MVWREGTEGYGEGDGTELLVNYMSPISSDAKGLHKASNNLGETHARIYSPGPSSSKQD